MLAIVHHALIFLSHSERCNAINVDRNTSLAGFITTCSAVPETLKTSAPAKGWCASPWTLSQLNSFIRWPECCHQAGFRPAASFDWVRYARRVDLRSAHLC